MENSNEIKEILRNFSTNITNSRYQVRHNIFLSLTNSGILKDLPEAGYKALLKIIYLTVSRYHDNKSRKLIDNLVICLANINFEATLLATNSCLKEFAELQKRNVGCHSNSAQCLTALRWLCLLLNIGLQKKFNNQEVIKATIELQCYFVYGCKSTGRKSFIDCSNKYLFLLFSKNETCIELYRSVLFDLQITPFHFSLINTLFKYLEKYKHSEIILKFMPKVMDMYSEQVIKGNQVFTENFHADCKEFLKHVTHKDFQTILFPIIDRCLLRNPETALPCLEGIMQGVNIDLSLYSLDIGKHLATQCLSKEESQCNKAANASKLLAAQCSNSEAVSQLIDHFFLVLSGGSIKLSLVSQKTGLLQCIGNISYHLVSGSDANNKINCQVIDSFIKYMQTESHETTLINACDAMALWCKKLVGDLPKTLLQFVKSSFSLKTFTSVVKTALIQCLNSLNSMDLKRQCSELLPLLLQEVEKICNTSLSLATNGLLIQCVLLILSIIETDSNTNVKLDSFWSIIQDCDKQFLTNNKFLNQASDKAIISSVTLVEKLLINHLQKLNDRQLKLYVIIFIIGATHSKYEVRKLTSDKIKKILSLPAALQISKHLIEEFESLINSQKTIVMDESKEEEKISGRLFCDCLSNISLLNNDQQDDKIEIALRILNIAHHPFICEYSNDCWVDIVCSMKLDPKEIIDSNCSSICDYYFKLNKLSKCELSSLSKMALISPEATFSKFLEKISAVASDEALLKVTNKEYALLHWPEGELYDKSVIDVSKVNETTANMKRENKLYSYKEQLADQEIKKELAKTKSVKEEVKLSKKQQEIVQAQLAKESNTRNKLKTMDSNVEQCCLLITSFLEGNEYETRNVLPVILPKILPLLKSPLAAPYIMRLYILLSKAAFDEEHTHLGDLIAHCTLRALEPQCEQPPTYLNEVLADQKMRCVDQLFLIIVASVGRPSSLERPLSPGTFAYCYPLLASVLSNLWTQQGQEDEAEKCIAILATHARIRSYSKSTQMDPQNLPLASMFQLLIQVISDTVGRSQQHAIAAILELANCASGDEGCATAGAEEIQALLKGLDNPMSIVRESILQSLIVLEDILYDLPKDTKLYNSLLVRFWMAKFDVEKDNQQFGERLLEKYLVPDTDKFYSSLLSFVVSDVSCCRQSAAEALSAVIAENKKYLTIVVEQLLALYEEKLIITPAVYDQYGRMVTDASPDQHEARHGISAAIGCLASHLQSNHVKTLFEFFITTAFFDRNHNVRSEMLKSAISILNSHGKENIDQLLPLLEHFLTNAPSTANYDIARQSVVILLGTLAKHLDPTEARVKPIVARLVDTLSTPSQEVQEAVANCLSPLVGAIKEGAPDLVKSLLTLLLESDNYGERRGAAYGIAGLIKGLGILSLKQLDIINILTEAIQDKRNPKHREGALFAFEMLCLLLGRLFEPYVVHLLPHLLLCFGDSNQHIREAADETAKAVMSKLSAHGVKLVLPSLLAALNEDSWRTKCGSVELLGAMAFCAPKQLSACLPNIVPKLTEVLTDSHPKVQKAGAQSLKQIGSVIKNPEIQVVVPVLLEALQDPTNKTTTVLQRLLDTKFVHFIDAASLALIMPVVQRALNERSTNLKKMAAQIVGNMYSLTDQKDLAPYLPTMIPGLKLSLLSPMPEVRSVSARAFGTMVRSMGEDGAEHLVPWLMQTLTSENSSVDRSGAAQGLAEVVGGLGLSRLQSLMPDIIQTASRTDITPNVRDGYIMMYIYLPVVFADDFTPYVGPIIPSILKALADETEYVRDTALRAGQRIVNQYADTAVMLLLPEVEKGLVDDNWRIRCSSLKLMGDLLFRISGVTGKMTTDGADEDDNFGNESIQKIILNSLGVERRDRVFAGLYICRSDTELKVRQEALHVWKLIVSHTPRMIRDILPTLFQLLLGFLANHNADKREVAGRALGDIVKKLGEKVLPEIIPILENGLTSADGDRRVGVCIGLTEIMAATSRDHVLVYADSLIPTICKALCDPLPEVRSSAAKTFDTLHANLGHRALDDILPYLLKQLIVPDVSEFALDGLKQVMSVKSKVVLPYLVPQLTTPPVNTRALSLLSSVAGDALNKHLNKILPALLLSFSSSIGTSNEQQEMQYCCSVITSINDEIAIRSMMDILITSTAATNSMATRKSAVSMILMFCQQTKSDYSDFVVQLLRMLIHLTIETDIALLEPVWECLNTITQKMQTTEMIQYISHIRQAIKFAVTDLKGTLLLPGFCIPNKGIAPILPIFREGILSGSPEVKESAALGLTELIRRTSSEALKPSVINITGPLIRILGDRFNFTVKVAILDALTLLLVKCGIVMKPFLPQLQMTFLKSLVDQNRPVRLRAAAAVGQFISIHPRVDSIFAELQGIVKSADDVAIRDTSLQAIRHCLLGVSANLSDKTQKDLLLFFEQFANSADDSTRIVSATCLGTLCLRADEEVIQMFAAKVLDMSNNTDWLVRHFRSVALSIALKEAPVKLQTKQLIERTKKALLDSISTDRIPICLSGFKAVAFLLRYQIENNVPIDQDLFIYISKAMKQESNDVRQLGGQIGAFIGTILHSPNTNEVVAKAVVKQLVPLMIAGCRERNAAVKSHCEHGLAVLLQIEDDDQHLSMCREIFDSNTVEAIIELTTKSLRKARSQLDVTDEDIDNTLLK